MECEDGLDSKYNINYILTMEWFVDTPKDFHDNKHLARKKTRNFCFKLSLYSKYARYNFKLINV